MIWFNQDHPKKKHASGRYGPANRSRISIPFGAIGIQSACFGISDVSIPGIDTFKIPQVGVAAGLPGAFPGANPVGDPFFEIKEGIFEASQNHHHHHPSLPSVRPFQPPPRQLISSSRVETAPSPSNPTRRSACVLHPYSPVRRLIAVLVYS